MPKIRKQRHIQDYYQTLYRIERNPTLAQRIADLERKNQILQEKIDDLEMERQILKEENDPLASTVSSETDVAAFPESPACGIARPPSQPSLSSFSEEDDAEERLSPAIGSSSGFSDGVLPNGSALGPSFFSSSSPSRSEETEVESIVSRP